MKKFNVTFTEKKRYNPATRTIEVQANDELHATNLIHSQFGSFRWDKKLMMNIPSDKKIGINKVEEVKEEKEKK
jgi:ribosomal protein L20A (L18A)